jgi:Domain of unknown function (DUF4262)
LSELRRTLVATTTERCGRVAGSATTPKPPWRITSTNCGETIREHGWAVQFVEDEGRPFAYAIGLHHRGLPELLMTGLPPLTANRLLNSIAHMMVDDGTVLAPAMHIDHQGEFLLEVVEVEHPDAHLKFAVARCGPRVRALQLV